MKKILLTSLVASSVVFGASNEQIIGFYSQMLPPSVNVKVNERTKIENSNIESVIITLSDGKNSENDVVFTSGDFVFPDVLDLKNHKSLKAEFGEKMLAKNLSSVYKSEDAKNIIAIGNDPKKPTKVMFSDPECPYCRAELKNIEKTLKDENLKIILTPVHDISALQKSFLIYKDVASAKTDSDKVKILRKYFDENYNVPSGSVTDQQVAQMNDLRQKYFAAGVRSVPKYVDEAGLK